MTPGPHRIKQAVQLTRNCLSGGTGHATDFAHTRTGATKSESGGAAKPCQGRVGPASENCGFKMRREVQPFVKGETRPAIEGAIAGCAEVTQGKSLAAALRQRCVASTWRAATRETLRRCSELEQPRSKQRRLEQRSYGPLVVKVVQQNWTWRRNEPLRALTH